MGSYFNVGDIILFGRWKNKRARIVRLFTDDRNVPMVEVEPIPKGRKSNKTFSLFKIWHAPEGIDMTLAEKVAARHNEAKANESLVARVRNAHLSNKTADLSIGKTMETDKWRVHRYTDTLQITDLTNAGKRGKKVTVLSLSLRVQIGTSSMISEAVQDEVLLRVRRGEDVNKMIAALDDLKETGSDYYKHEERGVDVMPAGFQPVEINGDQVYLKVGLKDFTVRDKKDQNNLPTCIPAMKGGLKAIPLFYRWVQDNKSKLESMTFQQVMKAMDDLDVPYHYYCAMD